MWDYGKEITVTLEDALYTPASQSLMWGGKFGTKHSKIYGGWNPYVYPKDKLGRNIYLKKEVAVHGNETENGDKEKWYWVNDKGAPDIGQDKELKEDDLRECVHIICPCDGREKMIRFVPNYSELRVKEDNTATTGNSNNGQVHYHEKEFHKQKYKSYTLDTTGGCWEKGKLEKAEISIDNFGKFDFTAYSSHDPNQNGVEINNWYSVTPDNKPAWCDSTADIYEYKWEDTDIKMCSLEGDMDTFYAENAVLFYRTEVEGTESDIQIGTRDLYYYGREMKMKDNEPNSDFYTNNKGDRIRSLVRHYVAEENTKMIKTETNEDRGEKYETMTGIRYSIGTTAYPGDKRIVFYIHITYEIPSADGKLVTCVGVAPVGVFYIIEDWNYNYYSAQDLIYPINSGFEDVPVLERMEKCVASQNFAINTDRNTRMGNYRYMQEYSDAELTVYIDPKTMKPYEPNTDIFQRKNGSEVKGNLRLIKQYEVYYKWTRTHAPKHTTLGSRIIVDAVHYPGTYRLVGETYVRRRQDGKDQRYQFEIPLCKMSSDTSLTLEAAGDPTTFTMNMKVLRREDGVMMKITQYDVDKQKYDGYKSGSTNVVPSDKVIDDNPIYDDEVRLTKTS